MNKLPSVHALHCLAAGVTPCVEPVTVASPLYHVTVENQGQTFWLRGTTWAFRAERGETFTTMGRAQEALNKAKPFMKASLFRKASVVPVTQ